MVEHRADRQNDIPNLWQHGTLQPPVIRNRCVESGDPLNWRIKLVECSLLDQGGQLGAETAEAMALVDNQDAVSLANRTKYGIKIGRFEGPQVENIGFHSFGSQDLRSLER